MSDEIKALVERVSRLLPVVVNNTPDYAELSFGDAHPTQAMTMAPDDWVGLNDIAAALTAQAEEIERLRARLEITDEITERYDGIACRDETIRLLEQKIAALKAAQEVKAIESGEHLKEGR